MTPSDQYRLKMFHQIKSAFLEKHAFMENPDAKSENPFVAALLGGGRAGTTAAGGVAGGYAGVILPFMLQAARRKLVGAGALKRLYGNLGIPFVASVPAVAGLGAWGGDRLGKAIFGGYGVKPEEPSFLTKLLNKSGSHAKQAGPLALAPALGAAAGSLAGYRGPDDSAGKLEGQFRGGAIGAGAGTGTMLGALLAAMALQSAGVKQKEHPNLHALSVLAGAGLGGYGGGKAVQGILGKPGRQARKEEDDE